MAILVPTGYITPHFTWQEAQCKDGCVMPEAVKPMVLAQAHVLEAVRHALGDQALAVDSWYRGLRGARDSGSAGAEGVHAPSGWGNGHQA